MYTNLRRKGLSHHLYTVNLSSMLSPNILLLSTLYSIKQSYNTSQKKWKTSPLANYWTSISYNPKMSIEGNYAQKLHSEVECWQAIDTIWKRWRMSPKRITASWTYNVLCMKLIAWVWSLLTKGVRRNIPARHIRLPAKHGLQ
jgi:hypothetical protein